VQTRYLGRSDVRVTEIALGTWGLASGAYGAVPESRFEDTVRAAWEAGVTTFDLAPLWGHGASERVTGKALGRNLKDAVLITRVGQVESGDRVLAQFDAIAVGPAIDLSLERIGREWIDVVLLHNPPDAALTNDRFARGLGAAMASGKVRSWGVSTSSLDGARVAIKLGAQVICLPFNALAPDDVEELMPMLKEQGVALFARSPLAYGLLGGNVTTSTKFAAGDHRADRWTEASLAARLDRVATLKTFAKDGDVADLALRCVLANPFVTAALVGARTPDQIRHAARASKDGPPYLENATLKQIALLPK
jgi:aryl-alcohol dehydrogenase-like predicted oxidoreductase